MAMRWKNLILSALLLWGVVPAVGAVAIDVAPTPANQALAATEAQKREADRKCRNERFKESCKRGVLGALEKESRGTACKNLTGESLTVCRNYYDANKPADAPDADEDCPEGAVKVSPAFGIEGNCIGGTKQNPIFAMLSVVISFLTALFGMILVFVIVISGFQYILAAGDSDNVKGAKDRLKAAATGLVLFILMYSVLQLLLPPDVSIFR